MGWSGNLDSWREFNKSLYQDEISASVNYLVLAIEITVEEEPPISYSRNNLWRWGSYIVLDEAREAIKEMKQCKVPESNSIEAEAWQVLGEKTV